MRVVKFFGVLALFASLHLSALANNPITIEDKAAQEKLRTELIAILNNTDFTAFGAQNLKATIHFVINSKQNLKVIEIYSDNEDLRLLIEQKLDNHKVSSPGVRIGKNYVLPIRFKLNQ